VILAEWRGSVRVIARGVNYYLLLICIRKLRAHGPCEAKFVIYDTSRWADKRMRVRETVFVDGPRAPQELIDILLLGVICKLKLSAKLKVLPQWRVNAKTLIYILFPRVMRRDIMIDRGTETGREREREGRIHIILSIIESCFGINQLSRNTKET